MKNWMIGSVAAAALLAACGGQDKAEDTSPAIAEFAVGDVELPTLSLRSGDASEAADALAALSLNTSGAGRISFADNSTDGADATFSDVVISVEGEEVGITAGSLVLKGLEMTDSGANFSQLSLNNVSLTPPDEDTGPITIASMQLTNPSAELANWVASLMGEGEPAEFPALSELNFDGLSLNDMSIAGEGIEELEAFSISNFDMRSFSDKGIGSMVLKGLNIAVNDSGNDFNASLSSMKVAGLNATVMQVIALASAEGDSEAVASELMSVMQNNAGDPGYDAFLVDDLDINVMGLGFDVPSVEAAVTRDSQGRATRSVTKPYNFTVTADPEGQVGGQLAGPLGLMGYEALNFSGEGDIRMDPDADTVSFAAGDNFLTLEDGFTMSFGGGFGGLSGYYAALAEAVQNGADDEEAGLAALTALSLESLEFSLTDDSIMERAFTTAAAMTGQDADALQAQAITGVAALPFLAAQAGVDAALANDMAGALASFLSDSGTLRIKLDPSEPLSAANIQDPSELTKERLGFSAVAE